MDKITIIGCGGHARSVGDVLINNNPSIQIIFVDKNAKIGETIFQHPIVKNIKKDERNFHVAFGDNEHRREFSQNYSYKAISIISKIATIGYGVNIEDGVFIAQKSFVGPQSNIGTGTIINTGSIIEHEVTIGSFSHIAPNSTICGRVILGSNVFIGAGSTVIDKVKICSNVIIGANSTVIGNILEPGTYVGQPVRKVK